MKPLGRNGVTKDAQNTAGGYCGRHKHFAGVARLVLPLRLDGLPKMQNSHNADRKWMYYTYAAVSSLKVQNETLHKNN